MYIIKYDRHPGLAMHGHFNYWYVMGNQYLGRQTRVQDSGICIVVRERAACWRFSIIYFFQLKRKRGGTFFFSNRVCDSCGKEVNNAPLGSRGNSKWWAGKAGFSAWERRDEGYRCSQARARGGRGEHLSTGFFHTLRNCFSLSLSLSLWVSTVCVYH